MRRGPKEKSRIEYARAAYWVCNLSYISGKSFTDLERLVTPWAVRKRDGGGFIQPYAFKKYATGQRTPSETGSQSPILLAEQHFPGSSSAYYSIFWDIVEMGVNSKTSTELEEVYKRTNLDVIKRLENVLLSPNLPILSDVGKFEARFLSSLDAFALLLLTIRSSEAITVRDINDLQSWVVFNIKTQPFAMCSDLLLGILEEAIPELGIVTGPIGFIQNHKTRSFNSLLSALMSGRKIEFPWTVDTQFEE